MHADYSSTVLICVAKNSHTRSCPYRGTEHSPAPAETGQCQDCRNVRFRGDCAAVDCGLRPLKTSLHLPL